MGSSPSLSGARARITNLGALVGAVGTFFWINALDEVIKVLIGAALGWLVGLAVYVQFVHTRRERHADELRSRPRSELVEEARRLEIPSCTEMSRDELIKAITGGGPEADQATEAMKDALDGAKSQLGKVWGRRRPRRR